ncbi:hypothetical protein EBR96_00015 [bacterium]|nr:hypothetical protein [bacterium]
MTPAKSGYKRQPTSYLRILSFILPLILISGCARTFTSRETQLNISIDIAVAGSIDLSANNYYVVFSTTTTPLLPADSAPFIYFPSPGIQFNEPLLITYGGLSTYYFSQQSRVAAPTSLSNSRFSKWIRPPLNYSSKFARLNEQIPLTTAVVLGIVFPARS